MQTHDDSLRGYPALARIMGPYQGMAIFKRFATLNAHSLLMQQAELLLLERDLDATMASDRDDGLSYDEKAADLINSADDGPDDVQWELTIKIRERLEKYNAALVRQSEINKLAEPRGYDLKILREWLKREKGGNNFLQGVEDLPWHVKETRDLVVLSESERTPLIGWVAEKVVPWLFGTGLQKRAPMPGFNDSLVEWNDRSYQTAARILCILASAVIPSVAIIVLYFIRNMLARILVSIALSTAFSIAVAVLTSARSAEIFAATAAFAAVQVVFIGSDTLS